MKGREIVFEIPGKTKQIARIAAEQLVEVIRDLGPKKGLKAQSAKVPASAKQRPPKGFEMDH